MSENSDTKRLIEEICRQELKEKPKLSVKTSRSFNYAAFVFPVIYNLVYKRYNLALFCVFLTWLPHAVDHFVSSTVYFYLVNVTALLIIAAATFSGFTGNVAAYNARAYDDENDFIKTQRFWIPLVIVGIIIHIAIYPIQKTGHLNTINMIRFAEAKQTVKLAIQEGLKDGKTLGVGVIGDKIIPHFAKYLKGRFDGIDTISMPNGTTYKIEGYEQECGSRGQNTYFEKKTACAKITVDLNGRLAPNETMSLDDLDKIKSLLNRRDRLKDRYTLYVYNDDLAAKQGTVEEFALQRFERK